MIADQPALCILATILIPHPHSELEPIIRLVTADRVDDPDSLHI
jgi:hypothetical protein